MGEVLTPYIESGDINTLYRLYQVSSNFAHYLDNEEVLEYLSNKLNIGVYTNSFKRLVEVYDDMVREEYKRNATHETHGLSQIKLFREALLNENVGIVKDIIRSIDEGEKNWFRYISISIETIPFISQYMFYVLYRLDAFKYIELNGLLIHLKENNRDDILDYLIYDIKYITSGVFEDILDSNLTVSSTYFAIRTISYLFHKYFPYEFKEYVTRKKVIQRLIQQSNLRATHHDFKKTIPFIEHLMKN